MPFTVISDATVCGKSRGDVLDDADLDGINTAALIIAGHITDAPVTKPAKPGKPVDADVDPAGD